MTEPPDFDDAFVARLGLLMRWRRDVRRFRADPLPEVAMRALLDAASLAPSVGNAQPWRFVRVRSAGLRGALVAHVDAAAERAACGIEDAGRRAAHRALRLHGLHEAPEIVAVLNDEAPAAGHGLGRATMPETLRYSTVMAIHALWLAARARGVGVGWVSIVDPATVTAMLDVPASWTLIALLCIGYPAEPDHVPELERLGWQAREAVEARILER